MLGCLSVAFTSELHFLTQRDTRDSPAARFRVLLWFLTKADSDCLSSNDITVTAEHHSPSRIRLVGTAVLQLIYRLSHSCPAGEEEEYNVTATQ